MSEYIPTTDEVRDSYDYQSTLGMSDISRIAEFDRWLASVKAEAWDEGFDAGVDNAVLKEFVFNPYTIKSERAQQYIQDKLRDDKRGQTKTKARE